MMRKFTCILLCVILLGLLPACKNEDEKRDGTSVVEPTDTTNEDSSLSPDNPLPKSPSVEEVDAKLAQKNPAIPEVLVSTFSNGDFILAEDSDRIAYARWKEEAQAEIWEAWETGRDTPLEIYMPQTDYEPLTLSRFNSDKQLLWEKTYDNLNNMLHTLFPLSDNSLLIVTNRDFRIINDRSIDPILGADMTKISPDGEILWTKELTENHSYMADFFEGDNEEFYGFGAYSCHPEIITEPASAEEPWDWDEGEVSYRPTITRYNSEGDVIDSLLPDVVFYEDYHENKTSYSDAVYQPNVGLIYNLGTRLVCYDKNLKIVWSAEYPNMKIRNQDQYPDNICHPVSDISIRGDEIVITAVNCNENKSRDLRFSFDGKLLGEKISDLPLENPDWDEEDWSDYTN